MASVHDLLEGCRVGDLKFDEITTILRRFAQERDWDQYHTPRNLILALVGEVGELAEIFQWRHDASTPVGLHGWVENDRVHVGEEMADCLLYLLRLADRCEVDIRRAVLDKLAKNAAKYPKELVQGSSAKYTAYQTAKAESSKRVVAPSRLVTWRPLNGQLDNLAAMFGIGIVAGVTAAILSTMFAALRKR